MRPRLLHKEGLQFSAATPKELPTLYQRQWSSFSCDLLFYSPSVLDHFRAKCGFCCGQFLQLDWCIYQE